MELADTERHYVKVSSLQFCKILGDYCVKVIMEFVYIERHYVKVSSIQVYIFYIYWKITVFLGDCSVKSS